MQKTTSRDEGDEKVLGLSWDRMNDRLRFDFEELLKDVSVQNVTKRSILSSKAKMFDPLGVLSPIIIYLKEFISTTLQGKM